MGTRTSRRALLAVGPLARRFGRTLIVAWCVGSVGDALDVRGNMCSRCKSGGASDGGLRVDPSIGCVQWCSHAGYCGHGEAYSRGLDCRKRDDVGAHELERARASSARERENRYDAKWLARCGRQPIKRAIVGGYV
jgi:hypothetical protein